LAALVASSAPIQPAPSGAGWIGADHRQLEPGPQRRAQRGGVVEGAQHALRALAGQPHRCGPGGRHQGTERVFGLVRAKHAVAKAGSRLTQPQVHAERGRVGPQRSVVDLARHELLGQRGAVVGRPVLRANHGDAALIPARPQFLRRPQPGQARAGYHHPPDVHRPQG